MSAPVNDKWYRCWVCGGMFETAEEWELRHSDQETGEDVHEDCCRDCPTDTDGHR